MGIDLHIILDALVDLSNHELEAIMKSTYEGRSIAPGFVAWLEHLTEWELRRRGGLYARLQPPEEAIPPEERAISIATAKAWRERFQDSPDVVTLFDAIVRVLTGTGGAAASAEYP